MNASPPGSEGPSVAEAGYARPGDGDYDIHAPAPWIAFLRKYVWVIGTILLLAIVTLTRPFLIRRPPPPEITGVVPSVALLDQEGARFDVDTMHGRVWVVGFVFTRCPSTCPAVSAAMAEFHQQIREAGLDEHVHVLTVTVDPENDTPEVLREYGTKLGADFATWRFVTGDQEAIEHFVVDGFKVAVGERKLVAPGVFDIAHSTKLALVDRNGNVRGVYSIDADGLEELFHRALATMRIPAEEENT